MTQLQVNGQAQRLDVPPDMPLLWALRDTLGMTGTKFGCGKAMCGSCTVHVDGQPTRACVTPVAAVQGSQVSTIEGMAGDPIGRIVQAAWVEHNVAQCGYCQAGQIMSAVSLLKANPRPTSQQIDEAMSGNICRCGTYPRIRAAIEHAIGQLSKAGV